MYKKAKVTIKIIFTTKVNIPTNPLSILGPQNPSFNMLYVAGKRQSADFEALKLREVRSGCAIAFGMTKETKLERADFTLQLLMFVTEEKEGVMFIIFSLSIFVSCCPRHFKLARAECVHTMKALTNRPRRQLFLI